MSRPTGGAEPSYLSLNSCTSADIFEASDAECDDEKLVRRFICVCVVLYVCVCIVAGRWVSLNIYIEEIVAQLK